MMAEIKPSAKMTFLINLLFKRKNNVIANPRGEIVARAGCFAMAMMNNSNI